MRTIHMFIALLISFASMATLPEAEKAYEEGDYNLAIELYSAELKEDKVNPDLEYNLGNAYYRTGQIGHAIFHWEKALKGNPSMKRAKENLELAYQQVEDDQPSNRVSEPSWYVSLAMMGMPGLWAYLAVILLIFTTILAVLFMWKREWRRWTFLTGSSTLVFALLLLGVHWIGLKNLKTQEHAIVLPSFLEVKTAPTTNGVRTFEVHAGTKLTLIRQKEDWCEVQLGENRGWAPKSSLGLY